jgi:integrase
MEGEVLTQAAAKAAPAQDRAYKLADSGGLHLFVSPTGAKSWRLRYRWQGREKLLTIGRFPAISLPEARLAREAAKATLRQGADPAGGTRSRDSFEQLARDWHAHAQESWSPDHAAEVLASLARDVFPAIGGDRLDTIDPRRLLELLRAIEARGSLVTARRVHHRLSAIFRFGVAHGLVERDPAATLRAAMRARPAVAPMRAITDVAECRALLAAIATLEARPATKLAARLLALTAVRLDAVRGARWSEIHDLDGAEPRWVVPAARMKLGRAKKDDRRYDHTVPLSAAAVSALQAARGLVVDNSNDVLIFPGRTRVTPIGANAILELIGRTPFAGRHVPHGWRASFSTILNEDLGPEWRDDIDRALAHSPKSLVEAAYNRSAQLGRRRRLFDRWSELLTA